MDSEKTSGTPEQKYKTVKKVSFTSYDDAKNGQSKLDVERSRIRRLSDGTFELHIKEALLKKQEEVVVVEEKPAKRHKNDVKGRK